MGSDDYFIKKLKEMNVDPNELKAMRAKKSKNLNKNNLQNNNNNNNQETQGSFEEAGRSMMTMTPSASALPVSTVIDVMNTESVDAEQVNIIHSSLQEAMNDLMIPVDTSGIADNGDDDIDQMIDQITKNRRSSAAKTAAAVAPGGSKLPRPNTAPPAFNRKSRSPSPTRTITSPPQTKRKAHSRSPSPSGSPVSTSIIQSSFLASPSQLSQNDLKPTERIMIRPFSANDIFQHTSLPTDQLNSPSLKRKFETTKRLDQIIENLETISITGIQAENSLTYPAVATMDEIIEKSIQQNYATNIRPLSATHESKPHLSMFIDASSTIGGALPTAALQVPSYTSTMEGSDSLPENSRLTKSSSDPGKTEPLQNTIIINTKTIATDPGTIDPANRLLEISQRYEEAILQSKIYSQQFHLYDPLNHKRNVDKEKSNKNSKERYEDHQYQSTSSAMQQFITKYYTEDIIDMEKEQKTLEKKRLYIQATAAGEKTTYGFYRVVDIFQFISFTELLTLVDMKDPIVQQILNSEKQSKLFYFNENGLDFSKIVYNQPYYYLQEILEILLDFYNYEENILIKDLLFYRDESPRLPFISLYHLVEIFFSQSKNVSFHLRIFMFISGCTLIYDLFKNAIPPKEFNIKINVKETVTSTTAGDREEEEQEEGNHAIGNNEQMEGTVKVGRKLSISRKSEEALNINVPESRSPFKSASNRAVSPAVTPKSTTTAGRANVITKASSFSSLPEKVSKVKSQLQNNISNDRKLNKKQSGSRLTTAASTAETKPEGSDSEDDDNDEDAESKAEEKKKKELSPPKPLERRASTVRFSQKDETTDVEAAVRTVAEAFNATNRSAIASTTKTSDEGGNTSPGKANAQKRRSNIAIVAMESDHRQRQRSILIGDLPYQPKEDSNRLVLKVPHNPNIPKGYLLRHTLLLAPLSGKYIVRPHPKRGFRLWLIKRSQFKKISKTLNMWAEGNIECLNVQDFVEIFCSLVPKGDRDNYRIIRNITSSLNRAGIKLIMELNSEILTRILENILEMKIISG